MKWAFCLKKTQNILALSILSFMFMLTAIIYTFLYKKKSSYVSDVAETVERKDRESCNMPELKISGNNKLEEMLDDEKYEPEHLNVGKNEKDLDNFLENSSSTGDETCSNNKEKINLHNFFQEDKEIETFDVNNPLINIKAIYNSNPEQKYISVLLEELCNGCINFYIKCNLSVNLTLNSFIEYLESLCNRFEIIGFLRNLFVEDPDKIQFINKLTEENTYFMFKFIEINEIKNKNLKDLLQFKTMDSYGTKNLDFELVKFRIIYFKSHENDSLLSSINLSQSKRHIGSEIDYLNEEESLSLVEKIEKLNSQFFEKNDNFENRDIDEHNVAVCSSEHESAVINEEVSQNETKKLDYSIQKISNDLYNENKSIISDEQSLIAFYYLNEIFLIDFEKFILYLEQSKLKYKSDINQFDDDRLKFLADTDICKLNILKKILEDSKNEIYEGEERMVTTENSTALNDFNPRIYSETYILNEKIDNLKIKNITMINDTTQDDIIANLMELKLNENNIVIFLYKKGRDCKFYRILKQIDENQNSNNLENSDLEIESKKKENSIKTSKKICNQILDNDIFTEDNLAWINFIIIDDFFLQLTDSFECLNQNVELGGEEDDLFFDEFTGDDSALLYGLDKNNADEYDFLKEANLQEPNKAAVEYSPMLSPSIENECNYENLKVKKDLELWKRSSNVYNKLVFIEEEDFKPKEQTETVECFLINDLCNNYTDITSR